MRREVGDLLDNMYLSINNDIANRREPMLLQVLLDLLRHGLQSEPYLVSQNGWSGLRHIVSVIASRWPLHSKWQDPTIEEIIEIVRCNPKFLELGTNQIRARSGHSIRVSQRKVSRTGVGNDNQAEMASITALRFVLKILRHSAEEHLINLDEHGWINVDDLILVVNYQFQFHRHWKDWNRATVQSICELHDDRLEIQDANIRARYGHSISNVKVAGIDVPPRRLLHGTSSSTLPWILQSGLQPAGRNYVHLTSDMQYAQSIGETIAAPAKPVILEIDTVACRKLDIGFHRANKHVWLAISLPPSVITKADAP